MAETTTSEPQVSPPLTFDDFLWLHHNREANPLFHYLSPWRRGVFTRMVLVAFVLIHVAMALAVVFGQVPVQVIVVLTLIPLGLVTGPICFLAFAKRQSGHELMELYLTRLSRSEVVYGSVIWGLWCGVLAVLVQTALLAWIFVTTSVGVTSWPDLDDVLVALLVLVFFAGLGCLIVVKTLRVWLATPTVGWLVVFTAPLAAIFDFVVLLGTITLGGMIGSAFNRGAPGIAALLLMIIGTLVALLLLFRYNIAMSLRWASALFYAEYDGVPVRQLIMGRFARNKAEASR